DADPARQHGDVGDETDVAHEQIALGPGIASEDSQLALIRREAEDRVERRGLPRAIRTDEAEDAAFLDAQIDAAESDRRAVGFAETACFYDRHRFNAPSSRPSAALPASAPAAEWLR